MTPFAPYIQLDQMDCGPTCLRMIAKHHGKAYSSKYLRERCYIDKTGVSLSGISEAAESIGMRSLAVQIPFQSNASDEPSLTDAPLPLIVHWEGRHFVVVYKITSSYVYMADPAIGKVKLSHNEFKKGFHNHEHIGIALLLETSPEFYNIENDEPKPKGFSFLFQYLKPYKKLILQLVLGLLLGTVIQLIFPFLTQSLVDIGIDTRNLNFIYIVLAGQLMLFFSNTVVQFIQGWIMLHVSVRINVNLLYDFLIKLMKLPIRFFDAQNVGDLLQRTGDHDRIELFITQSLLRFVLGVLNILVFGFVLAIYSTQIFLVFLFASLFYLGWIYIFLSKRKKIDHKMFSRKSENQDAIIEMINGMQEIKLQGSQLKRRWKWAKIQARLFKLQIKSLAITQYQEAGTMSISQLKDILITFISAKAVLDGNMTLGTMLAIQYIIGQLNAPLQQFVSFIREGQDAAISLERLSEIHSKENEEQNLDYKIDHIPDNDITIENLTFSYSPVSGEVLKNINLKIPRGKTTAIVGTSGSGKTTLIKLLLGFYQPDSGKLMIGTTPLDSIYQKIWRKACGVVMQEGYIFSDTIANNISESDDFVNYKKVLSSIHTANISDFIQSLPLGLNTMIGAAGNSLSQGQKQRVLIARCVYKNPDFLFFDEATNALDANNEKIIMENLDTFLKGRTSIVVAHRLSTVKNADQIIVLEKGEIVEQGTHETLVAKRGYYFTLVKNQLELGN